MDACSHGALCPWCLTVVVHALAVDTRWGESSETFQHTDGCYKETSMESHYTFLEQDHPLYREYRKLETLLLSTRVAMSTQERETWMATALAKAGHDSDLIISALLWISPVHADTPGEMVQDPAPRVDAV